MTIKEQYIKLFDEIRSIFDNEGYRPGFNEFPKDVTDYFNINFKYEKLERQYQPNFVFEITNKQTKQYLKLIIVASSLLSVSFYNEFREQVISDDFSGIVTIKKNFFKSVAPVLSIIIFAEKNTEKYFSSVNNTEDLYNVIFDRTNHCRKVFLSDKIDSKNLQPEHYNPTNKKFYSIINSFNPKKLEDIAEIIPGAKADSFCFTNKNDDAGIPYLRARCIQNGEIIFDEKKIKKELYEKYSKQLLQPGDILITRYYGQRKIAQVKEKNIPAIASAMLIIIRPFEDLEFNLFEYLSEGIGAQLFNKQLQDITNNTPVATFSLKDLKELQIPTVSMNSFDTFESEFQRQLLEIQRVTLTFLKGENDLCKLLKSELLEQGWSDKDVLLEPKIGNIRPDILLMDSGKPIAFFELKAPERFNPSLLRQQLQYMQKELKIPGIISLGSYYEVYTFKNNDIKVKNFFSAPTKKDILKILKEDC